MVHVQGQHVLIHSLDHDQVILALDLQLQNGVHALVTQDCLELQDVHVNVHRVQLVAVDNSWNAEVTTQAAGSALAELGAQLALQAGNVSHDFLLQILCFRLL